MILFTGFLGGRRGVVEHLVCAAGLSEPLSHLVYFVASYCWFSHDITKIQTKKLSTLPRFYFHDAFGQLKTNCQKKFRFKRVLGFVIEYA